MSLYYDNLNQFCAEYRKDSEVPFCNWLLHTKSKDIPKPIIDKASSDWKWIKTAREKNKKDAENASTNSKRNI